jgi:hypothetical protein
MPRLTGKMDYSAYSVAEGDLAALVLPAYLDFADAEAVAAQLGVMHGNGLVLPSLAPQFAATKTGVLLGRITEMKAVPAALLSGIEELVLPAASSAGAAGDNDGNASAAEASTGASAGSASALLATATAAAAAKAASSKRAAAASSAPAKPQWKLVTLLVSHKASKRGHFKFTGGSTGAGGGGGGSGGAAGGAGAGTDDGDLAMADGRASAGGAPELASSEFDEAQTTLVTVPWLPAHSTLMPAPFMLRADKYADAVDRELLPGAQVRVMFADVSGAMQGAGIE